MQFDLRLVSSVEKCFLDEELSVHPEYTAARALRENTDLTAAQIAEKALHIAASICVFTNDHIRVEVVDCE